MKADQIQFEQDEDNQPCSALVKDALGFDPDNDSEECEKTVDTFSAE